MITAGASLPFYNEPAMAQLSAVRNMPPDAVKINANENPLGPCAEARDAACNIVAKGGRYMYGETDKVAKILSEQEGVKQEYIRIYAGSSAPLHQTVLAFTTPTKALVMGDPTSVPERELEPPPQPVRPAEQDYGTPLLVQCRVERFDLLALCGGSLSTLPRLRRSQIS